MCRERLIATFNPVSSHIEYSDFNQTQQMSMATLSLMNDDRIDIDIAIIDDFILEENETIIFFFSHELDIVPDEIVIDLPDSFTITIIDNESKYIP